MRNFSQKYILLIIFSIFGIGGFTFRTLAHQYGCQDGFFRKED
jgi:hypothetical protein